MQTLSQKTKEQPKKSAKPKTLYPRIGLDTNIINELRTEAEVLGISAWDNLRRILGDYYVTKKSKQLKTF